MVGVLVLFVWLVVWYEWMVVFGYGVCSEMMSVDVIVLVWVSELVVVEVGVDLGFVVGDEVIVMFMDYV